MLKDDFKLTVSLEDLSKELLDGTPEGTENRHLLAPKHLKSLSSKKQVYELYLEVFKMVPHQLAPAEICKACKINPASQKLLSCARVLYKEYRNENYKNDPHFMTLQLLDEVAIGRFRPELLQEASDERKEEEVDTKLMRAQNMYQRELNVVHDDKLFNLRKVFSENEQIKASIKTVKEKVREINFRDEGQDFYSLEKAESSLKNTLEKEFKSELADYHPFTKRSRDSMETIDDIKYEEEFRKKAKRRDQLSRRRH